MMEKVLLKKVIATDLRPYIEVSRNVSLLNNAFVMHPRTGSLVLNLNGTNATSCTITFKRISGNGVVSLNSFGKNNGYQINSQTFQGLSVDVGGDYKVHLHRTHRSRGDLAILDISLYGFKDMIDWNAELKKCETHACLRLVGDELIAASDAFIKGSGIDIQTSPPNMFYKEGNLVRFKGACKVTSLSIGASADYIPTPIPEPVYVPPIEPLKIIYDTQMFGFSQVHCNNATASTTSVVLDNKGSYTVPLKSIVGGKNYVITIYVSRLDGNGKLLFGFLPSKNATYNVVGGASVKTFSIQAVPELGDQNYSVSIWRHSSSKGRVQINRITVHEGVLSGSITRQPIHVELTSSVPVTHQQLVQPEIFESFTNYNPVDMSIYDAVEFSSKKFAILPAFTATNAINDIQGSVFVRGYGSRLWLNKIQSMYPGIVNDPKSSNIGFCDIGCVGGFSNFRAVWVEEFVGDQKQQLQSLANVKVILTPSLTNQVMLREWFKNADVRLVGLPLPKIIDKNNTGNYYFYVENSRAYTKHLLSIWNPENEIHISGTKVRIPSFGKYISEYDTFETFSAELANSKGLISFGVNTHYISGIIDLALSLGVPVLTNNHNYINKAVVLRHVPSSPIDSSMLKFGLDRLKEGQPETCYNDKVIRTLHEMGVV